MKSKVKCYIFQSKIKLMFKKNEITAHQFGIAMFGVTFTILGGALMINLKTTIIAMRSLVAMPWIPSFGISAFAYFVVFAILLGGVSLFVPQARNLGYHLLALVLIIFAIANLFTAGGVNFHNFAMSFILMATLIITAYIDETK